MRPVLLQVIGFLYIMSFMFYFLDVTLMQHTQFEVVNFNGEPITTLENARNTAVIFEQARDETANPASDGDELIQRIQRGVETAYNTVWVIIDLVTASYTWNILYLLGIPPIIITVMKFFLLPFLIAVQIFYWISGRV